METKEAFLLKILVASAIMAVKRHSALGKAAVACYGTQSTSDKCGTLRLSCNRDEVIHVTALEYRLKTIYKCHTQGVCPKEENDCCEYSENDCKKDYETRRRLHFYQQCSGGNSCSQQVQWSTMSNECTEAPQNISVSNYARATYECVKGDPKVNILSQCRIGSADKDPVHLLVRSFTGCSNLFCTASVKSDTNISVTLVDVRLNRREKECSSTILNVNGMPINCDPNNFTYNDVQNLQQRTMNLSITNIRANGDQDVPEMVWIMFKGIKGDGKTTKVKVYCSTDSTTTQTTVSALETATTLSHGLLSSEATSKSTTMTTTETTNPVTTETTNPFTTETTTSASTATTTSSSAGEDNSSAAQSAEAFDPVPIVVSVILVVLLVAVAFVAFFLWRKGKCLQKPKLKSVLKIGSSSKSHEHKANNYVDPNNIDRDRQRARSASPAISMPPAGNYFELEPQYAEPEVRNSTYAEIPEDHQPEVDHQTLSEYDKLGAKQKKSVADTANDYSHVKINEDPTPYSHIGKRNHSEASSRKPLSDYSHIQPVQGFSLKAHETGSDGDLTSKDMSEYSHLANYRNHGGTDNETEEENAYDHTEGSTNVDETDTYSHLHAS